MVEIGRSKFLVDCGLFQGPKQLRTLNWEDFLGAAKIDAVFLTHAHIDHTGFLPRLFKSGFKGPIYCSQATADLCQFMLLDAAYLQEEDARYANKSRHSKHYPALALFTKEDAEAVLRLFRSIPDNEWINVAQDVSVRLQRSGHLLGSRFVQLNIGGNRNYICTFSGDLGHDLSHIIKGPVSISQTDALVLESTYGDRSYERVDPFSAIEDLVLKVYNRDGVLVIPAFAVGRTQEMLFVIGELKREKRIPNIKVYIDSPMALHATKTYKEHVSELKPIISGDDVVDPFHFADFEPVCSTDDSMLLCMQDGPFIVISASGMLSGGRVMHHLKHRLPDPKNAILFVGYQAKETKGRLLQEGIKTLRIHHVEVPVEAEICTMDSLSAHANTPETINWLRGFIHPIKHIFLNHGEPAALEALSQCIKRELGWETKIPILGQSFEI
ncbi:MAG: MBL fold metallo-hydrolase [Oligoflexales bacterium]|nr:MBL fold metallo-hydrolase [Oligoflexales bacterium]